MNKEQQKQVLRGVYLEAINTMLEAVENRQQAVRKYEQYLYTIETTIQVFNPEFNIERDLKLPSRGLDEGTLRYVTVLDRDTQKQQLNFYQDTRNSL